MPERLDLDAVIDHLAEYEGWEQDGVWLSKRYEFDDFAAALDFVNRVGEIAEEMNHHPDIAIEDYSEVVLAITTHEADGITDRDFDFVDRVEDIVDPS